MKILLLILVLVFAGCGEQSVSTNTNSATEAAKPSKEENEQTKKQAQTEKMKAINSFVAAKYPDWKLKGIEETEAYPFIDLNLEKGKESKVIRVTYKEFTDTNGQPYKVVSEVAKSDLVKKRDENLRNEWKNDALTNIIILPDDEQEVIKNYYRDLIAQEDAARQEDFDPPEMY
ncbi:MAG: hypothetical protein M3033_12775 [Acidobacteriota bacterium]|nr:hypothetical protein [Acidobacteriota bacterium]